METKKIRLVEHLLRKCNSYRKPIGVAHFLRKVQLVSKTDPGCTFLEKNATCMKKWSCIFLVKSATHIENWSELHIFLRKVQLISKTNWSAHFLRKLQLVSKTGLSCTFLEKSATRIKNRLGLQSY